jgi:membrane-associated phospholipid phosphatase
LKKLIVALFCCFIAFEANAQVTDTAKKDLADTIKKDLLTAPDTVKHLHSKVWTLVPPVALITYGALSFEIHPIRQLDFDVQRAVAHTDPTFSTKAESYFEFAPIVMVYGLNLAGIEGKNRFVDRTALIGLSAIFAGISTTILKYSTHRLRPNGTDYLSFPSDHTTAAFAGAEFLAQEYSDNSVWYSVAGYTIAATTGIFRLYNRDHWFSDVVAGAGFGILSTKAAYLVYPYIRNKLTHTDKKGRSTMVMPIYQNGAPGLSFAMQL